MTKVGFFFCYLGREGGGGEPYALPPLWNPALSSNSACFIHCAMAFTNGTKHAIVVTLFLRVDEGIPNNTRVSLLYGDTIMYLPFPGR